MNHSYVSDNIQQFFVVDLLFYLLQDESIDFLVTVYSLILFC